MSDRKQRVWESLKDVRDAAEQRGLGEGTMMEPVAWTTQSQLNLVKELPNDASGHMWGKRDVQEVRDFYEDQAIPEDIPLVRLSDAEARIAELEAAADQCEAQATEDDTGAIWRYWRAKAEATTARADAAEALLQEAKAALEPFSVRADRWPMNTDSARVSVRLGDLRAARAISDKIGVNDE